MTNRFNAEYYEMQRANFPPEKLIQNHDVQIANSPKDRKRNVKIVIGVPIESTLPAIGDPIANDHCTRATLYSHHDYFSEMMINAVVEKEMLDRALEQHVSRMQTDERNSSNSDSAISNRHEKIKCYCNIDRYHNNDRYHKNNSHIRNSYHDNDRYHKNDRYRNDSCCNHRKYRSCRAYVVCTLAFMMIMIASTIFLSRRSKTHSSHHSNSSWGIEWILFGFALFLYCVGMLFVRMRN